MCSEGASSINPAVLQLQQLQSLQEAWDYRHPNLRLHPTDHAQVGMGHLALICSHVHTSDQGSSVHVFQWALQEFSLHVQGATVPLQAGNPAAVQPDLGVPELQHLWRSREAAIGITNFVSTIWSLCFSMLCVL